MATLSMSVVGVCDRFDQRIDESKMIERDNEIDSDSMKEQGDERDNDETMRYKKRQKGNERDKDQQKDKVDQTKEQRERWGTVVGWQYSTYKHFELCSLLLGRLLHTHCVDQLGMHRFDCDPQSLYREPINMEVDREIEMDMEKGREVNRKSGRVVVLLLPGAGTYFGLVDHSVALNQLSSFFVVVGFSLTFISHCYVFLGG